MIQYSDKFPARSEELTVSACIHKGPALVLAFTISAVGANGTAILYDGANANGVRKSTLAALDATSFERNLRPGIECLTGIYIAVNAATTYAQVVFTPGRECPDFK